MTNQSIPTSLLPHLNEIAARLWSGHAAVMVGAGFSKNAIPKSNPCPSFPDWNKLGEAFYKKTRGEDLKDGKFLNVLKLADEVQASFGRPTLHQLLRDEIPDSEYEPSKLHIELLRLPWSDVLTTNYDTLLERASSSVTEHNYQLVVNSKNLVYSERPRIIKLHGSFPNAEPFIITEEDYRKYPVDFAPFVNTVQQSLLENTLCLVGFSGDDPNFLRWIGWIRDNLGEENSPKIYLIGVLGLSKAQTSLLAKYNIIPIDMSESPEIDSTDHFKGIKAFLDFCYSKKSESDKLDWPKYPSKIFPKSKNEEEKKEATAEIVSEWCKQRESYPGWAVLPEDNRGKLWAHTQHWEGFIKETGEIPPTLLLDYLYEYYWRIEKCLMPIFDNNVKLIEFALNYGEEKIEQSDQPTSPEKNKAFHTSELKEKLCFLQLTYLRYLREEGKIGDWNKNKTRAIKFISNDGEYCRLQYEICMFLLFEFNVEDLDIQLQQWTVKPNQPFWVAKKAGLVAETGRIDESITMLESALKTVRSRLNLKPVTTDYSDVSQESYILVLLQFVKHSTVPFPEINNERKENSERWNHLKNFRCDPWNELKLLEQGLKGEHVEQPLTDKKPNFEVGSYTRVRTLGGAYPGINSAFNLLKFIEEIGAPLKLGNTTFAKKGAIKAIDRLSTIVPYWCMSTLLRIGDSKVVDAIFNRKSLLTMTQNDVISLVKNYIAIFYNVPLNGNHRSDAQKDLIKSVVPEILSRLLSKCTEAEKAATLELIIDSVNSDIYSDYSELNKLSKGFMSAVSENDILNYLPDLIRIPSKSTNEELSFRNFKNPLYYLSKTGHLEKELINFPRGFHIDKSNIKNLIDGIENGPSEIRRNNTSILFPLFFMDILSEEQKSSFTDALWSLTDSNGFPEHTDYLKFAFCLLAPPNNSDKSSLIKDFILNQNFPIQKDRTEKSIPFIGGAIYLCSEIIGVSENIGWTTNEIHTLFEKFFYWWDSDKEFLKETGSDDIKEEFNSRFMTLSLALQSLSKSDTSSVSEAEIKKLKSMIENMADYGLPVCSLKTSFSNLIPSWNQGIRKNTTQYFLDEDEDFIKDAFMSMEYAFKSNTDIKNKAATRSFTNLISNSLSIRDRKRIVRSLLFTKTIVTHSQHHFNSTLEEATLFSLEKLLIETGTPNMSFPIDEALTIRMLAASLAFRLFLYYQNKGEAAPETILKWRAVCRSPEEFIEIRNSWIF